MRILDMNGNELVSADLSAGRLVGERLLIAKHDAVHAVEEVWHYEVVKEYPNGGKDVLKIVDVPGVAAQDAWDEYEMIYRYVPYTQEELNAPKPLSIEERLTALENSAVVPEFEVGKWYYRGDNVRFEGEVFACVAPKEVVCVWSPAEYSAYWQKR